MNKELPMESLQWEHSVPASMTWYQGQNPFGFNQLIKNSHGSKRKSPFNEESPQPLKQYVSEEAMAAHLDQLHIVPPTQPSQLQSSSTSDHFNCLANNSEYEDLPTSSSQCDVNNVTNGFSDFITTRLEDKLKHPSVLGESEPPKSHLILSPDIVKIQPDPILPRSVLDELKKPSMELVLWRPPVGLLDSLIRTALDEPKDENANDKETTNFSTTKFQPFIEPYCDKQDAYTHQQFQMVRVVPAMTATEIESMEEDINM
ncbi:hypothetical protein CHUAL_005817 [Chamberlinius hualienensis]